MKIRYKYRDNETINYILENCQTIAVVGHSSRQERAGYYVPAYMQQHGYHIIPVNPNLESSLGEKAYAKLSDVPEAVNLVLIFRRSEVVPPLVDEAIQIDAKAVWMQLGIVNIEASKAAQEAGLKVVMNACMMVEHRRR
jgi:predicted CoA-binding protein